MDRKMLQILELSLVAVSVIYMIFTFIAFDFTTTIAIGAVFPCAFALLLYFKAEKAAAIVTIVYAVLGLWDIVTLINIAINWSAGFGFSYYLFQFARVAVTAALYLIIGIALLKRIKHSRTMSVVIGILGGAVILNALINAVKALIGGGMYAFRYGCIDLFVVAMDVLIVLIAIFSLSSKQTSAMDSNDPVNFPER